MDIWTYIKSDLTRYVENYSNKIFIKQLFVNRSFQYTFWLRLTHHKSKLIKYIAIIVHKYLSNKYHIYIPRSLKIGYGFYISHRMCIVINPTVSIGNNVNISQFTNIGSNEGQAATIGDNVYIGPQVCIVEDVKIGNNSTIGAGCVVVKDVPENATVVGTPAKVISYDNPGRYIKRKWKCN